MAKRIASDVPSSQRREPPTTKEQQRAGATKQNTEKHSGEYSRKRTETTQRRREGRRGQRGEERPVVRVDLAK